MSPRWHNEIGIGRRSTGYFVNSDNKSGSHVRQWSRDTLETTSQAIREHNSSSHAELQVQTAVVHSSTAPSEHRTLVCTSLSRDIEVKLEEIEVLEQSVSPDTSQIQEAGSSKRKQQLLAGGTVLMERGKDTTMTFEDLEKFEFADLEDHVWLLLWLVLGPPRLQHLSYMAREEDGLHIPWTRDGSRLVWRALQLCCSARGTKSASAVPLPDDHECNLVCLRDHASRMLEVCAPTRELWRNFGWAGLTVDAVLQKILREDLMPLVLPSLPNEVAEALRRIEVYQDVLKKFSSGRYLNHTENESSLDSNDGPTSSTGVIRRKRGRPAKSPLNNRREPGRLERVFLWRFLLELLEDARLSGGCLRWVQREEGIFRILNTDMLARLWGRRHGNPRMTYEKMARAMRTYYRSRVLLPVPRARNLPRKLVYRFSPSVLQRFQSNDSAPRPSLSINTSRVLSGNLSVPAPSQTSL